MVNRIPVEVDPTKVPFTANEDETKVLREAGLIVWGTPSAKAAVIGCAAHILGVLEEVRPGEILNCLGPDAVSRSRCAAILRELAVADQIERTGPNPYVNGYAVVVGSELDVLKQEQPIPSRCPRFGHAVYDPDPGTLA